ncbi:hypothetical protein [Natrialba sp. SSL1]|uniref:hypothetical protein n=1 Tax=Natrialba sp. SSL1 TaxID=1869245 RepID=UPI001113AD23|nr:hypothetical protein [Natrialba sp. SSL1]
MFSESIFYFIERVTAGIDRATSDAETVDTLVIQVEELTEHVTGLEDRITDLEDDVDDDSSSNGPDQKGAGSTKMPTEQEDPSQESTTADGLPGSDQAGIAPLSSKVSRIQMRGCFLHSERGYKRRYRKVRTLNSSCLML